MDSTVGPLVRRRRLGQELRRLREASGRRLEEVAQYLECSAAKISRIENGRVPARPRDVRDMLELYGVPDERRESLLAEAAECRQPGWWREFLDAMPKRFDTYVGLEAAAHKAETYEGMLVPALLRTPEYQRALLEATTDASPEQIDRRLRLLAERQKRLTDERNPLQLHVIVDEAAVTRQVGGREVMRDQLRHMVAMSHLPNVTLQLVERRAGPYPSIGLPFTILSFDGARELDVVHIAQFTASALFEDPADIRHYQLVFHQTSTMAGPPWSGPVPE